VIDGADYGIIDNSIQLQGDPLIPPTQFGVAAAMSASGVSAVPEPAATSLVACASVALLARRRRRSIGS
jgi:hypothetical protein